MFLDNGDRVGGHAIKVRVNDVNNLKVAPQEETTSGQGLESHPRHQHFFHSGKNND
jgi:hypothetical protein